MFRSRRVRHAGRGTRTGVHPQGVPRPDKSLTEAVSRGYARDVLVMDLGVLLRSRGGAQVVFLAVALFSTAALGALAWLVWQKDAELAAARRHERFDQAGAAFATAVNPALTAAGTASGPTGKTTMPDGAILLAIHADRVSLSHGLRCTSSAGTTGSCSSG
jgi:hypothetical protein